MKAAGSLALVIVAMPCLAQGERPGSAATPAPTAVAPSKPMVLTPSEASQAVPSPEQASDQGQSKTSSPGLAPSPEAPAVAPLSEATKPETLKPDVAPPVSTMAPPIEKDAAAPGGNRGGAPPSGSIAGTNEPAPSTGSEQGGTAPSASSAPSKPDAKSPSSVYAESAAPPPPAAKGPAVATWTTFLYQGPSFRFMVLDEVPQDQHFEVLGCANQWCEVFYANHRGYVTQNIVATGDPSKPEPGVFAQPAAALSPRQPNGPCFEADVQGGNGGNAPTVFCMKSQ